jgi:RNA polymerase sigma-54 factor
LERSATGRADQPRPVQHGAGQAFDDAEEQLAARPSATERLAAQAALLVDPGDLDIVVYLLGCLDSHGYLRASSEALAGELGVSRAAVERAMRALHELEPPGIGARDVRECLLIQCARLESQGADGELTRRILAEAWDDFVSQRWEAAARKLGVTKKEIENARRFVANNLYPYPLLMLEDATDGHELFPYVDLIVHREAHGHSVSYSLEIPGAEEFELRVSPGFESALGAGADDGNALLPGERAWIRTHLERARLFMAALNRRWATLRRIGEYLVAYQADFMEHGWRHLKPSTRARLAQALGLHESTVSRAVADKTMQLPDGRLVLLSDLFDNSLAAKEAMRNLLAAAPKALSDHEIADHLQAEGISLARRTVAKYRHQLNIPSSYRQQYKRA